MSNFNIDSAYTEVAERMKMARELWPASIFRPVDPLNPYQGPMATPPMTQAHGPHIDAGL